MMVPNAAKAWTGAAPSTGATRSIGERGWIAAEAPDVAVAIFADPPKKAK